MIFRIEKNKIFQVVLIFSGLVVFYSSTFSGTMISGDNQTQFDQTLQILEKGQIGFDEPLNHPVFRTRDRYKQGQNGLFYQCYGIGHSLLTLPGTALAYFMSPSSYQHRKGLIMKAWLFHSVFFSAVTVTCYWIIVVLC